jgi:hypothetical protein
MQTIHPAQLALVVGAAAPSPSGPSASPGGSNNLADWLPKNPSEIRSPDMTAYSNPPSPNFRTNTPMVSSPPNRSWQQGADKMFRDLGM